MESSFLLSFSFFPSSFVLPSLSPCLMCSSSENWCLCPALLSWEHTGRGHLRVSIRARDRDKASGNQENPLEVLEWKVQIMTIWTVLQRPLGFQLFQRLHTNSTIWLWHGAPISTREQKPFLHLHLLAHTIPLLDPSRSKVFKGKEFTSQTEILIQLAFFP